LRPRRSLGFGVWALGFGIFLVPVQGYDKGCSPENVESIGIAA
jgi:hypothetical protein